MFGRTPERDFFNPGAQIAERPIGESQQFLVSRALVGEARVVEFFAAPGGFAEVLQPDHARTALQRMEGAPDRGEQGQLSRRLAQLGQSVCGIGQYLACLFQKDFAKFVVLPGVRCSGGFGRRNCRFAQAHDLRLERRRVRHR